MNSTTKKLPKCPLCGVPVSLKEKKAAEYACLYVCIRVIPYPEHLLLKHPEYVKEAKNVARPIFYPALILTLLSLITYVLIGPTIYVLALAGVASTFWYAGMIIRKRLIEKYKEPGNVNHA